MVKRALVLMVGFLALSLLVACGGDDGEGGSSEGAYVGTVEGTDAYIALVSDGSQLAGYISDSKKLSTWVDQAKIAEVPSSPSAPPQAALGESMEALFAHHVDLPGLEDDAALTTREGEALGEVTLSGSEASGHVEVDGKKRSFTAKLASGEAGLYRAAKGTLGEPGSVEAGWVVLADGSQRGNVNITDPSDLNVEPAPNLNPAASTVRLTSGVTKPINLRVNTIINPDGI